MVLCRKHSCLITHDNTVRNEQRYLKDKILAKEAADSGLNLSVKALQEAAKLVGKVDAKKSKDAAAAAATASEQLRKSLLSKEELEVERQDKLKQRRAKVAANKSLRELKEQALAKEYNDAVASLAAKNALNAVNAV